MESIKKFKGVQKERGREEKKEKRGRETLKRKEEIKMIVPVLKQHKIDQHEEEKLW